MNQGAETEIKLEVRNLAATRRKIRSLGFWIIKARHFESNSLYDFSDLRLRTARCLVRIRRTKRNSLLTFKGPPTGSPEYKSRMEIETVVEDAERLSAILEGLGLHQAFRYDKYRTVFAQKTPERGARWAQLFLDETPVGDFLELEGPGPWIDRMAAGLGYRCEDYITASYAALYRKFCEAHGEAPADMVFKTRGD